MVGGTAFAPRPPHPHCEPWFPSNVRRQVRIGNIRFRGYFMMHQGEQP
jgi:hypothetical protein